MADLNVTLQFEGMALKGYFPIFDDSPSHEGPVEVELTCPDEVVDT